MLSTTSSDLATRVISIEALLAPIPGDNPAGENLKFAGLHDDIREARRADDGMEQGEWKRETKASDWYQVLVLASGALAAKTKDLQICSWLTEALVKLHGFAGLRDGLSLTRGIIDQFWDNVYPEIDEGSLEARANSLEWMDHYRHIPLAIKEVLITESLSGVNYSYLQWEGSNEYDVPEDVEELEAEERMLVDERRRRAAEEGKITSEQWRKAKNATRREFYESRYAMLAECWEEFLALDALIDEKFGRQAPSLSAIKKSLDAVRSVIEKLVKEKRALEPSAPNDEEKSAIVSDSQGSDSQVGDSQAAYSTVVDSAAAHSRSIGSQFSEVVGEPILTRTSGAVETREEAFRRLAEVADYFRRAEPHSPVSYLVQRAIKWGQMPLELWLQDVIKNGGVLDDLRETLGLKAASEGGGTEQS